MQGELHKRKKAVAEQSDAIKPASGPPPRPRLSNKRKGDHTPAIGFIVGAFLLSIGVWVAWTLLPTLPSLPPDLRPFPGTKLTSLPQFQGEHQQKFFWGTYRPGLYFGMRPRVPKSLIFGMMWVDPLRPDALENIRHEALQRDGLSRYGWLAHDGESYGRQELLDEQYSIDTSWIKPQCSTDNDNDNTKCGRDWAARITAEYNTENSKQQDGSQKSDLVSFFVYLADENNAAIKLDTPPKYSQPAASSSATFSGQSEGVGKWKAVVKASSASSADRQQNGDANNNDLYAHTLLHSYGLRTPHLHNLTSAVQQGLWLSVYNQHHAHVRPIRLILPNLEDDGSNVMVLQVTGRLPLTVDIAFVGGGSLAKDGSVVDSSRASELLDGSLTKKLQQGEENFEKRFQETFPDVTDATVPGSIALAKAALSNLLGGIGYWYGQSLVKVKAGGKITGITDPILPMKETALFSAVPSRSFFPRGFLWDEGFHQLLVRRWNPALSRDILAHWLDCMTASGWIPREQILGSEARSRVPAEFVVQHPQAANPPSLFLPILEMLRDGNDSSDTTTTREDNKEFLSAAWPRLLTWYRWFGQSQSGQLPGSFRWRGRDHDITHELNPKTLTSGLDDYPRASHPSNEERHLDLLCWMALAGKAMLKIAKTTAAGLETIVPMDVVAQLTRDVELYSSFRNLKQMHWDSVRNKFADWGNHTELVQLVAVQNQAGSSDMVRKVKGVPVPQYVPHYGYVSLFPLLMKLIPPTSPILLEQLQALQSSQDLWTPYGIRSLSAQSSLYQKHNTQHDAPYWRGAIWGNINYLTLRALESYAKDAQQGEAAGDLAGKMASELRVNILTNLVKQYQETGYIWEQYEDSNGQGKGVNPFTGWTALLAVAVAEGSEF